MTDRRAQRDSAAAGRTVHICAAARDSRVVSELACHLTGVRVTHADTIPGGADSKAARRGQIDAADLIVLLVSADFAASAEHQEDAARAVERHRAKEALVVPVLSRAFALESLPYADLLTLPRDGRPIVVEQRLREESPSSLPPSVVEQQLREGTLAEVARELREMLTEPAAATVICPFPGLAFFDEERAADFFGREAEVSEALARLAEQRPPLRWLQIDGPSGAGKSSFARAGIVPAVRAGKLALGPKAWVTTVLRPGHDPIASLAEALVKHAKPSLALSGRDLDDVKAKLQSSPSALASLLREGCPAGHGVLLLVDQLEEAFTLAHDDETAVKQLDALLAAALADRDGPLLLVTTTRSDFVARMAELPALEDRLSRLQVVRFYLRGMAEPGLRAAIEKPAERAGLAYEAGLVDRIVAEASASRGALPLVAHVLEVLFARRERSTLTARGYELVGGVGGALTKSADAIVDGLAEDDRVRARQLLLRLVKIGRGSADAPQTAPREAALRAAGGGAAAERVLARLSGGRVVGLAGASDPPGRLVAVSGEPGNERVDLVHEALIARWATLRAWIKEEREALELRDDVEEAARIWEASGKDEGGLPKGTALVRFRGAERGTLQRAAKRFLDAAEEAERRAREEKRAQEEKKRKAVERRQRRVIAGLLAIVLGLVILSTRTILLARELEAAKRAQIRQANMNMAAMVAGTVLSQLRALSDAVERVASEEEVARALEADDWTTLQDICESTYELYEDPSHGLKPSGISPFDSWVFQNKDGEQLAKFGKVGRRVTGLRYAWRDYSKGVWKLTDKGLRSAYVSRAYRSDVDDNYRFVISAPVYGSDHRPVGVTIAGVASNANLGALDLDETQSIAVLVAPRDRERNEDRPATPYLILRHPAIAYAEGIGMDNEQVRRVSEADLDSEEHFERPLWPPAPGRVTSSDHYEDPVAKTHPEFGGTWLAGFAPVGHTGFVVIVQTRETEATTGTTLFWQLARWAGIASVPGAVLLVYQSWQARRRRRRSSEHA